MVDNPSANATCEFSMTDAFVYDRFVEECEQLAKRFGARFKPSRWLKARAALGQKFHADTDVSDAA
jgi:3-hydroxyacyl-CoA dehydrogenase/enoyl-CoA hydratase/3-hydroxybutyryl-CoA epimerase